MSRIQTRSIKEFVVKKNFDHFREPEAARLLACRIHGTTSPVIRIPFDDEYEAFLEPLLSDLAWHQCPEVHKAIDGVRFIADHIKREEDSIKV